MAPREERITRILVLHPAPETRRSIDLALRRASPFPVNIYEAESLTEGFQRARSLDPDVILLGLSEERSLALDLARELRRPDRLIIGLYNPLLMRERQDEFFRSAARAGIGDFVPLPVAEEELQAALAAARDSRREARPPEGRLVSFMSPKGGVGTTTLAVNTAVSLASSGAVEGGVALCDAALQFGVAAAYLGAVPDRDLGDLIRDPDAGTALSTYLFQQPETGLHVLASPRDPKDAARFEPEDMSRVLIGLCRQFGLVIADCPSTLDLLTLAVFDLSTTIHVVTEAIAPTLMATHGCLDLLEEQGFGERLQVVVNRHSGDEGVLSGRLVNENLGRPVDHVLPYDKAVVAATSRGVPLVVSRPKAEFSQAIQRLARTLAGPLEAPVRQPESVA